MSKTRNKPGVFRPAHRRVWPHEERTAVILAKAGHYVEFLPEGGSSSPDILLDGVVYEMKSPRSPKPNSMEQLIKDALYNKHCSNIVFDSHRVKGSTDEKICKFLVGQMRTRKAIRSILFITKRGRIIDISELI